MFLTRKTDLCQAKIKINILGGFTMEKTELERLANEERKAYFKAWRAVNRDKTAEHRRRYWEKKAMECLKAGEEGT